MELRVDNKHAILRGEIEGELNKEVAAEYFNEVLKLSAGNKLKGLLTDVRKAQLSADQKDMETLSQELVQLGLDDGLWRALVVKEDVGGYKKWENHNLMAGFKRLRLFVDCERAEEWLVEQ